MTNMAQVMSGCKIVLTYKLLDSFDIMINATSLQVLRN